MCSANVKLKVLGVKMQILLVFGLFWSVIMGYRLGDTHYTDYTNHRGHHIRHHHRDESHDHHGPLDSLLRRIDEQHKKDDVLSIEEASKQLQRAMDVYRKSIDAVKHHPWDDHSEKRNDGDEWLDETETVMANENDKNRGVDDGLANYDSNGVDLDDADSEKMDDMPLLELAADEPHSDNLASSESYSTTKWEALGTPERLRETMSSPEKLRRVRPSADDIQFVANSATSLTSCKKPMPVMVKISKVYPSLLNKAFRPDCVPLHMCSTLSGCCVESHHVCAPIKTEIVRVLLNVSFLIKSTERGKDRNTSKFRKEYFEFRNHTLCSCQPETKNNDTIDWTTFAHVSSVRRPTLPSNEQSTQLSVAGQRLTRNIVQNHSAVSSRIIQMPEAPPKTQEERCRCPSRYTARLLANGECICDCFDKQADCLRNKRGKDYFDKPDADCVRKGECHVPSCDYGDYMKYVGKCPGRVERFQDSWNRSKTPNNYHSSRAWRSNGS